MNKKPQYMTSAELLYAHRTAGQQVEQICQITRVNDPNRNAALHWQAIVAVEIQRRHLESMAGIHYFNVWD